MTKAKADDRGKWRNYDGNGLPCDPSDYVDVCEGEWDVWIDVPAQQSFDANISHWRPSIDDTPERKARRVDQDQPV